MHCTVWACCGAGQLVRLIAPRLVVVVWACSALGICMGPARVGNKVPLGALLQACFCVRAVAPGTAVRATCRALCVGCWVALLRDVAAERARRSARGCMRDVAPVSAGAGATGSVGRLSAWRCDIVCGVVARDSARALLCACAPHCACSGSQRSTWRCQCTSVCAVQ